jgi:hypothetical protein
VAGASPDWPAWRAQPLAPSAGHLGPLLDALPAHRWPDHDDFSHVAGDRGVRNARGLPLSFVPASQPAPAALDFEARIFERGEVETRVASWHDAFHALAWLAFPRAKARINELHVAAGTHATPNGRGVVRNVLTLIDEGGLIVTSTDLDLLERLRRFEWHALFWRERAAVQRAMTFTVFGHALLERTLSMHHGATGRGILFVVGADHLAADGDERLRRLDALLCEFLADPSAWTSGRDLHPVPIKGIPGWARENESEAYYFDTSQFRPGRREARAC